MDKDEYNTANQMAALVANTIEELPLDRMVDAVSYAETMGPFLDPTLYMQRIDALRIDAARIRILHKAQQDLVALRQRHAKEAR